MKKLEFGQDASISQILKSIKASEEEDIELNLPEDSPIFNNPINKEIIEKFAKKSGKKLHVSGLPVLNKPQDDDFGFMEGKDIAEKSDAKTEEEVGDTKPKPQPANTSKKGGWFNFLSKLKRRKKLLLFGGVGIVAVLIVFLMSFWFLPSADVKVIIESKTKTNQITLTASQKVSEVDFDEKIIPLTVEEVTKSGVESAKSTGRLTIGSPAKGRVTIGNFSTVTTKKYPAGTTLVNVSGQKTGLEFTLDTAVTVPKASSSGFNIIAGQSGVNVTAKAIGDEGNLPASTEFKVGGEDIGTIKAVNDIVFTGGEAKEVAAVSDKDRKELKDDLLEKLSDEAKKDLENKLKGSSVPEGGLKTEIIKESYDKAVGEESKEVSLTLDVKATAKLFKEDDLKKLLIDSMKATVPEGMIIDEELSTVEAEMYETEGEEEVEILGKINSVLVPDFDRQALRSVLSGKSFGSAASYLQSQENISGFEIEIRPAIFRIFKFMPFNSSRISVNIVREEKQNPDSEEAVKKESEGEDAE